MKPTLLLTEQQLKTYAPVTDQVTLTGVLRASILAAQRLELVPLIGEPLTDELVEQTEMGTVTADNRTLLDDYIAPMLANHAYVRFLPHAQVRLREQGPVRQVGQTVQPTTTEDLSPLIRSAMEAATGYGRQLVEYLTRERARYPAYRQWCDCRGSESANTAIGRKVFII